MPRSKRILNIVYVGALPPHPGGSAVSGSRLLIGFAARGHRVRALAPMVGDAAPSADAFAAAQPDIAVTRFAVPRFQTDPDTPAGDDYRDLERRAVQAGLQRLLSAERPDIVLVGRETFALYVPDVTAAHGVPFVLRMAGGTTNGILLGRYPDALVRQLLQHFARANRVVSPGQGLADGLRRLGLADAVVIRNAVDLQRFAPRPKNQDLLRRLAVQPSETVVMHLSNLKRIKRPLDLVASMKTTLARDPSLVYAIVGDGIMREATEAACRQLGLAHRLRMTGWIDYDAVPDFINLADIVVMMSEAEGLPRVALEAQACGRVLLSSDIPQVREVVAAGETGLLYRSGDVNDLAAKTLQAAADPALRAAIGGKARQQAERLYDIDMAVDAYLALFRDVIHHHRAGSVPG
jgi:glycosyltransferase involved in cell wall biosynthesis